jgi:hypothetical protein
VKIAPGLYSGFSKELDAFIASPEKATLDCFYLASMGRYAVDTSALDLSKLDERVIGKFSNVFPAKTMKFFERHYEKTARS